MENNICHFADNEHDENVIKDATVQPQVQEPANKSTYPHGSARAMIAQMVKNKKEYQKNAVREHKMNPEKRKLFADLKEEQRVADGR